MALLLIVLVLYGGNLLLREWRQSSADFTRATNALSGLTQARADLDEITTREATGLEQRMARWERAPAEMIDARIAGISQQLVALQSSVRGSAQRSVSLLTGDRESIVADLHGDMRIALLRWELGRLQSLRHARTLETLRLRHVSAYAELMRLTPAGEKAQCPRDPDSRRAALAARLSPGGLRRLALCRENRLAFEAYREFRSRRTAAATLAVSAVDVARQAAHPVVRQLEEAEAVVAKRTVGKVLHELAGYVPLALTILLSALLVPLLIKTFLYFVVAPFASRRPPVRILTGSSAAAVAAGGSVQAASSQSAVSQEVVVSPGQELLVHADYLQSSRAQGTARTRWLLDAAYPFASIAAGMTVLTRILPMRTESVVISSTTDPFSEIGVLRLEAGSAFVLQPRNLVGVLQEVGRPVRITSHWRLGSLTAWLTLQLRYLVFHGPGALIIEGCRGIRVEASEGGRMINQDATIGFSANLDYSVARTETFVPYLLGKQALLNDRFSGGPGFHVYEEMPHFGKKSGITGRGVEGVLDSVLKVFGI